MLINDYPYTGGQKDDPDFVANIEEQSINVIIVANVGACIGGFIAGHVSEVLNRRFVVIVLVAIAATLVYPYTVLALDNKGVYVVAFLIQFCIQGAFGVVPIYLVEMSPPAFRTFVVGASYQMGVLLGSPANAVIAEAAKRHHGGHYGYVIRIFSLVIMISLIIVMAAGKEKKGGSLVHGDSDGDSESDTELEEIGEASEDPTMAGARSFGGVMSGRAHIHMDNKEMGSSSQWPGTRVSEIEDV
jgi:MFS family permease